jgi:hypothetical protein
MGARQRMALTTTSRSNNDSPVLQHLLELLIAWPNSLRIFEKKIVVNSLLLFTRYYGESAADVLA